MNVNSPERVTFDLNSDYHTYSPSQNFDNLKSEIDAQQLLNDKGSLGGSLRYTVQDSRDKL